jgi:hypothetical protein
MILHKPLNKIKSMILPCGIIGITCKSWKITFIFVKKKLNTPLSIFLSKSLLEHFSLSRVDDLGEVYSKCKTERFVNRNPVITSTRYRFLQTKKSLSHKAKNAIVHITFLLMLKIKPNKCY